jgi:hypothetical protein
VGIRNYSKQSLHFCGLAFVYLRVKILFKMDLLEKQFQELVK